MGDPAGIGPELTAKAWAALHTTGPHFLWLGDPATLPETTPTKIIAHPNEAAETFPHALPILPIPLTTPATPGHPTPANTHAITQSIAQATALTCAGETAAVVTNPIAKSVLAAGGFQHPGHTEYLAALCNIPGKELMMLASPHLRVVLVSIHVSLRHAIETLTTERIIATSRKTADALKRDFGIPHPRLAIAGLNPHAGEDGLMGLEDREIVAPAVEALRQSGIDATGPLPPDTMFTIDARKTYDAAICLYHDQGLIPLKTLDIAQGVNITLGLPIIRTSPDHGTAFNIAGHDKADPSSLIAALHMAATLATNRNRNPS